MLIAVLNGQEGKELSLIKGSVARIRVAMLSDLGVPIDSTDDTPNTVELYDYADRRNASSQSIPLANTTAIAGYMTASVAAGTITCAVGKYFAFLRRVDAGGAGAISYSRMPVTVYVK